MSNPTHLQYTAEHEWVALDGETARVGVTAYAADALGDIVYVDLPAVGDTVTAGQTCGELESTKSVSDLYSPVTGEVVEVNKDVDSDPSLVNSDPFGEGWLFVVKVTATTDLLDAAAYDALLEA
ncbi:glycine cleavage system H protein [Nocardioides aromaticivorans]|uniref:Glycine cleavage system H protein n=1 Tax=Nocardioides aromaticivorans TaxID=200618 RepID=A0A7Y9ZGK1_9ACTN|nr:glycine cleavage system protein GcvH [Nocardioides aromaticivorans]NYI45052.1 glycine cleavage system H protein [Nocardioides aromaticivorans]